MAQHLARSSTGELLVLIDEHAVHIDGVDALGDAVGVAVSGGVLKLVVVEDDEVGVTQSTRMVPGNKQEPSVVYELLTPDTRGEIEFCMMVIPPKAYSCREPKGHFGEEVAFFYSGEEVQLEIDGDSYTLHHEDSIRIPGGAMHRWYNPTDETVQVIFAVSPPSF